MGMDTEVQQVEVCHGLLPEVINDMGETFSMGPSTSNLENFGSCQRENFGS